MSVRGWRDAPPGVCRSGIDLRYLFSCDGPCRIRADFARLPPRRIQLELVDRHEFRSGAVALHTVPSRLTAWLLPLARLRSRALRPPRRDSRGSGHSPQPFRGNCRVVGLEEERARAVVAGLRWYGVSRHPHLLFLSIFHLGATSDEGCAAGREPSAHAVIWLGTFCSWRWQRLSEATSSREQPWRFESRLAELAATISGSKPGGLATSVCPEACQQELLGRRRRTIGTP